MSPIRTFTYPCFATIVLLGMAACKDPGSATPPSKPKGAISCVGHAAIYVDGGDTVVGNVWYAYWNPPVDSAAGILEVGIIDSMRNDVVEDKLYLTRSGDSLLFAPSDPREPEYADSLSLYHIYGRETSDSLIVRYGWEFSSTNYYLKKLQ